MTLPWFLKDLCKIAGTVMLTVGITLVISWSLDYHDYVALWFDTLEKINIVLAVVFVIGHELYTRVAWIKRLCLMLCPWCEST